MGQSGLRKGTMWPGTPDIHMPRFIFCFCTGRYTLLHLTTGGCYLRHRFTLTSDLVQLARSNQSLSPLKPVIVLCFICFLSFEICWKWWSPFPKIWCSVSTSFLGALCELQPERAMEHCCSRRSLTGKVNNYPNIRLGFYDTRRTTRMTCYLYKLSQANYHWTEWVIHKTTVSH